ERPPGNLAVENPVLEGAVEADARLRQLLLEERALRHFGLEDQIERTAATGGAAGRGRTALGTIGQECEIGKGGIEAEISCVRGKGALGCKGSVIAFDAEIVRREALDAAGEPAGYTRCSGEKRVRCRNTEAKLFRRAVQCKVEGANDGAQFAAGFKVDAAAEIPFGKAREGGDVRCFDAQIAAEGIFGYRAGKVGHEIPAANLDRVERKRLASLPVAAGGEAQCLPECLGHVGALCRDARECTLGI